MHIPRTLCSKIKNSPYTLVCSFFSHQKRVQERINSRYIYIRMIQILVEISEKMYLKITFCNCNCFAENEEIRYANTSTQLFDNGGIVSDLILVSHLYMILYMIIWEELYNTSTFESDYPRVFEVRGHKGVGAGGGR